MKPNVLLMQSRSTAEFEYQEMRVLLDALQREKIVSSNRMNPVQANELNRYIERVVVANDRRPVLLPEELRNTTWKLVYTTMEVLPPDSTIQFTFHSGNDSSSSSKEAEGIEYQLVFGSQTIGLNAITVQGDWTLLPGQNTVGMTYDRWSLDAFGRRNIHVCLLQNLLRGRTNQIDTVYFDGTVWIEQVEPNSADDAGVKKPIWNVYYRKEDVSQRW